jgi:hypothetical protein
VISAQAVCAHFAPAPPAPGFFHAAPSGAGATRLPIRRNDADSSDFVTLASRRAALAVAFEP